MKFKQFRDLVKGDRFLFQASPHDYRSPIVWREAADTPKPLNDYDPEELWEVHTTCGKAITYPNATVTLEI